MGAEAAVIAGITLASAAAGGVSAQRQAKSARGSKRAAERAASVQRKQLRDQAAIEAEKRAREADDVRGRLAILRAASGTGVGGQFEALSRQADVDEAMNLAILDQNAANATDLVNSRLGVDFAQIGAGVQNPLLATVLSGLGGLQTGLSIAGSANALEKGKATPIKPVSEIGTGFDIGGGFTAEPGGF